MTEPDEIASTAVDLRQAKAATFLAGMTETGLALCIDKTDLHYLWDTLGRTYLDLTSGGGALPMGAYQAVNDYIWANPTTAFPHVSQFGDTCLQAQVDYAQAISERMPLVDGEPQQVAFVGSGAQAMNLATNLAKAHALSWANVKPLDAASYEPLDTGRAQKLCELTADRDQVIVIDERLTGYGRLGSFRAATRYDLEPWAAHTLTVFGEAMGGGIPIGAVVGPRRIMEGFRPQHAGDNFGGNPIACSAGLRILTLQDGMFYDHVRDLGDVFEAACEALRTQFPEVIVAHQGRGLARALRIEKHMDMGLLMQALLNNGVLAQTSFDHLLLRPPLIMNDGAIRQAFDQIAAALVDAVAASPAPASTVS
jgi:acetylornithine/succinyldiaminopimelate/putrescine aminotransferase